MGFSLANCAVMDKSVVSHPLPWGKHRSGNCLLQGLRRHPPVDEIQVRVNRVERIGRKIPLAQAGRQKKMDTERVSIFI